MRKFVSLFLVFSLLVLTGDLMAKKRGAELVVQKKDGQQVRGELITVKKNSLLLLDNEGTDVSVDVNDIRVVRIVKKSRAGKGAGLGFLTGGVVGAICGSAVPVEEEKPEPKSFFSGGLSIIEPSPRTSAIIVGVFIGVIIGALIGGGIGAAVGTDKTFQIEGKSDLEIKEVLEKLRKKARIPDYE